MKKLIIASLLLSAIFLVSAPAFASNSCICIGSGSSGMCGSGGIGGTFPRTVTPNDSDVNKYIKSTKARNDFAIYGKGYDATTVWFIYPSLPSFPYCTLIP